MREGERLRTLFMALYMLAALWAYYILRPISRALFLNRFDIDRLPWLYIIIAIVGGFLSYVYTKIAIRSSLRTAVTFTVIWAVTCLVLIWWMLQFNVTINTYATADSTPVSETGAFEFVSGETKYPLTLSQDRNNLNGLRDALQGLNAGLTAKVERTSNEQAPWRLAVHSTSPFTRSLGLRTKPGDAASNILSSLPWMLYVFEIWVKVFSIIIVSQGWLVAANVFNTREAKRVYGLLGVSSVIGAAAGASFTAFTVTAIGIRNLLLASSVTLVLGWLAFRGAISQPGVSLTGARAAEEEGESFSFKDIVKAIGTYRHLQVIIGIISLTYLVDVMVDYQWSAMAKNTYETKEELTVYMAAFQGPYTNAATFLLFMVTAFVVSRFGVGGTLQIMPVTISLASLMVFFNPTIVTTSIARLMEASMRYSFNRTGMELLYLPLPTELKNRTKAFVDVFVDRVARGVGAILLVFVTTVLAFGIKGVSLMIVCFGVASIFLCARARREYIATVRKRLSARRLDLESARVTVRDRTTLRLLEETATGDQPRQVTYALSLLQEVPGYDLRPLLDRLVSNGSGEVRAKVFEIAHAIRHAGVLDQALAEIRAQPPKDAAAARLAVRYAIAVSPEAGELAARLLNHPNPGVVESALESLTREQANDLIQVDWIRNAAADSDPGRRTMAAIAVRVRGDQGTEALHRLLQDEDQAVARAACQAAAAIGNRMYVELMIHRLGDVRVRGTAIESIAAYGTRIIGTLSDLLEDDNVPLSVRKQIPRVLRLISNQRSVDVLLRRIDEPNLAIRGAILRALNGLRESAPNLEYGREPVTRQILNEARYYYEMKAALMPFRDQNTPRSASSLLVSTLEDRLKKTIERLFRLLGLRYPPKEIYAAWLALRHVDSAEHSAAVDFLDSVLERDLKRILLPLLDSEDHMILSGRDLFGVELKSSEEAIRELLRANDPWVVACAVATAAELKLRSLTPEIVKLSEGSAGIEVAQVARSVVPVLG